VIEGKGRGLWDLIEARAAATPDALCCLDESGVRLSFAEYRDAVLRAAAGLSDLGLGADSRVTWVLPTRVVTLVLLGALARLSAVQNPVIPIYREREVGFITRETNAQMIIVPRAFRGFDYESMARALAAEHSNLLVQIVEHELPEGNPASLSSAAHPGSESVRWVFYTSGTTADPKGVRHTDQSLMATSIGYARSLDLQPGEKMSLVFPATHIGGPVCLMASLLSGAGQLVVEKFGPESVDFLARNGVHHAGSGTAFFSVYLDAQRRRPGQSIFPDIRTFPGGGAPKPPQLHFEMKNEIGGHGILSSYGLTECPLITMCNSGDPDEKLAMTEGQPNPPHAEIRVVQRDGTRDASGKEGELRVRGPQLFKGYVDVKLDAAAFDTDGFFKTGDLGFLDEDGYAVITGRLKDVIIRKAENISAKEIEDLLYEHPKVGDVAVIGVPDSVTGERVCAVVECESADASFSFEEMVSYLKAKRLMLQKIPEQLEIVDSIPRNPSGKIMKNSLRGRFA
jgi:cyclohexanecarboxylate-CoA ligase